MHAHVQRWNSDVNWWVVKIAFHNLEFPKAVAAKARFKFGLPQDNDTSILYSTQPTCLTLC